VIEENQVVLLERREVELKRRRERYDDEDTSGLESVCLIKESREKEGKVCLR
jgi:hypothetical protein